MRVDHDAGRAARVAVGLAAGVLTGVAGVLDFSMDFGVAVGVCERAEGTVLKFCQYCLLWLSFQESPH